MIRETEIAKEQKSELERKKEEKRRKQSLLLRGFKSNIVVDRYTIIILLRDADIMRIKQLKA